MKKHLTCLAPVVAFAKVRKWPQGEKETSVLMRSLITISESPSRIKGDEPSSRPKEIALATAKASTICEEYGRCTSSKRKQWSVPKSCESQFSQFPGQLSYILESFTVKVYLECTCWWRAPFDPRMSTSRGLRSWNAVCSVKLHECLLGILSDLCDIWATCMILCF